MTDEALWLERCAPGQRHVFPNAFWKRKDARERQNVTVVLDLSKEILAIEAPSAWQDEVIEGDERPSSREDKRPTVQQDQFLLSEIVVQCAAKEDDSSTRSRIMILPWSTYLRSSRAADANANRAPLRSSSSSQPIAGSLTASSGTKAPWVLYLPKPDARRFARAAMSAGVVQQGFSSIWRITSYGGSGGFSDVYVAKGPRGAEGAAKLIKPAFSTQSAEDADKSWKRCHDEIAALRALQDSPYVPQLYGSFIMSTRGEGVTTTSLCVVMQHLPVDLKAIRGEELLTEERLRPILQDLLRGLGHMHAKSYAHRDIKISNVMLKTASGPAFLIDYGFTVRVDPGVKERTIAGTQGYLAPELFRKSLWDCRPADLFSLGCLAYNLLSRVLVFHEGGEAEVMKRNRRGRVNWEHSPLDLSRELMRLLLGLFDLDEANRLTAEEALASPWLQTPTPTSSKSTAALDVELLDGSSQGQGSLTSLKSSVRGEDRGGVVTREASKELPALQCGVRTSKARPKPPDLVPLRTKRDQLDGGPGDGWGPTSPAPLSLSSPTGADYVMDFQLNKREENLLELDWGMQCESAKATTVPHIDFKMTEDDYLDGGEKLLELDLGENRGARPNRKNSRVEMAATAPEISYERSDLDVVETSRANGLRDTLQDGILEHLRSAAKAAAGKAKNSVTYFSRGFEASIRPSRSSSEAFSRLNQNSAQHSARVSPKSNHQFGFDRASLEASSPRWSKEKEVEWRSSTPFSPVAPDMSPGSPQLPTRIRRMMHRFSKEPHEENSETGGENFKHEAKTEPPQLCEESPQQVAFRPGAERKKDAYRRPNVVGT